MAKLYDVYLWRTRLGILFGMEDVMVNKELLPEAGYKEFVSPLYRNSELYISSFQKRFDDELGKKYFITVNTYDYTSINKDMGIKSEADSQFYIVRPDDSEITFNVQCFIDKDSTIDGMENFFSNIWTQMGCRHYERFDEC